MTLWLVELSAFKPWPVNYLASLGKMPYSHRVSLRAAGASMGTVEFIAGGEVTLRRTCIPFRGSENTPSHFTLRKLGYALSSLGSKPDWATWPEHRLYLHNKLTILPLGLPLLLLFVA